MQSTVQPPSAEAGNRSKLKRWVLDWGPIIVYSLLIFFQSSYPSMKQLPDLPHMDKLLHGAAYALLGFLFYRALSHSHIGRRALVVICLSAFLSTLYGVGDEIHQHFVVFRDADIMDVAADMVGSIAGAWAAHLILPRLKTAS